MLKKITHIYPAGAWLLIVGLSWSLQSSADTLAKPEPLNDPALNAVLNYDGNGEGVQIQSVIKHELDPGAPGVEQVVLWKVIGPTYWSVLISVVSEQGGQWKLLARRNLNGAEAELESVGADNLIVLDAKTPGPNDPICCPSQPKKLKYRYSLGKLLEVTPGATQ